VLAILLAMTMAAPSSLVAAAAADLAQLEAITWERERRGLIPPDFGGWLERARPDLKWNAPHFRVMQRALNAVTSGEALRVIFQVPIRHAKTEHNTISYNAYRLELDPTTRLLVISHNQQLALKFSRAIRRLAISRDVRMSPDRNTASEWETLEGGGVTALGIGSGTASLNADVITIDDPIGKRADAESEATRGAIWDALTDDVLARAEPGTAVLLTMSRWHMDDPVGRILDGRAGGEWQLIALPARAEENDPLGRAVGAPLWDAERNDEWLSAKLAELGSYGFASLLQGRPSPRGGGMFQWDWWQLMDAVPSTGQMIRYWDMAGTDTTGANDPDYTVGSLGCRLDDGRTAIVDIARFRLSVAARDAKIVETARDDRARYGGRVKWWFEAEAGIAGKERTENIMRQVQNVGLACYSERPTGSKEIRAEPLASKAEAGNVTLCPGVWRDPFRLEAAQFPTGAHDDQVDAAVGMDAKLSIPATQFVRIPSPWGA